MFGLFTKRKPQDLTATYLELARAGRWQEGLPLIEKIVRLAPQIPTSWFNYGVCLSALGREREAADAFLQAYRLDPHDHGTQFRAFRSLSLAGDFARFRDFAQSECAKDPAVIDALREHFPDVMNRPEFASLCTPA